MSEKPYSEKLLKEFDGLTASLSSPDQLDRINARLTMNKFVAEHGEDVCDAMFAELLKRDKKKAKR